ncbi:Multifunctional conjugation protein TraI [Corynebacterium atrinae]|nr:Multifunctional conjugation protein TraI [Corynebacterium atrinae]
MSFRAVHAGAGYQYLLRSVATNDAYDQSTETGKLASYYAAKGTPPGRWLGRGLAALESSSATTGQIVEADQMAALYGLGLHPDTDSKLLEGTSLKDCQLGGKFPSYTNNIPVLNALRSAESSFLREQNRLPLDAERSELAVSVGRPFYVEATGYTNAPARDVVAWVNLQRAEVKQAVAGYDLTFSPAKSVSVLWALSDERTASRIAACHHEAVAEVLAWAEDNVVRTRQGTGGLAQVRSRGLLAAEFTHFDTRSGDPDLHSHVLISNKVQGPDGRWRALDGRPLFMNHQTLSARYDSVMQEILTRKMGISFEASSRGRDKAPVWEVAGVPQKLIDVFSKRRTLARPVYETMLSAYVAKHGHQPDHQTVKQLWQAAILETRDAKKPAESLADLRATWAQEARTVSDGEDLIEKLKEMVGTSPQDRRPYFFGADDGQVRHELRKRGGQILESVIARRSYFSRHHITAAVGTALKGFRFENSDEVARAHQLLTETIVNDLVVDLSPSESPDLPLQLRTDGDASASGVDRHIGSEKYSTAAILHAEARVLSAVTEPTAVFSSSRVINAALEEHTREHGWSLNTGQAELSRHLLQCGSLVGVGVGPAGTGKTTSMRIVRDVWQAEGRRVVGLAPSAAAAQILGEEIGVDASTVDHLTHTWRGKNPEKNARDLGALPIQLRAGDMLLVDEAGMATTENLAALTEIAEASGAVLRLIGDPHQLDAVGAGGLFAALCKASDPAELTDVMRFAHGNDAEQAEASLNLRAGNLAALKFYEDRDWITGGTRTEMLTDAVEAYLADVALGRRVLLVAPTNSDVDALNEMIRDQRIRQGVVSITDELTLSRGDVAGVGDTIICRKNERLPDGERLINGQMFTIAEIRRDGGLLARDPASGACVSLPAEYVSQNVHLGYASTVHRAQGATVDVAHAIIDDSTDRSTLYVALTRGKKENRIWAVTDARLDEEAEEAHWLGSGNAAGLDAAEVLSRAITRDHRQRTATEVHLDEVVQARSLERLGQLYTYGVELASGQFTATYLDSFLDRLSVDEAARFSEQGGLSTVVATWHRLLAAGVDPRDLMTAAVTNLGDAENIGAVISYRLRDQAAELSTSSDVPAVPPASRGCDPELRDWLLRTRDLLISPEENQAVDLAVAGRRLVDTVMGARPVPSRGSRVTTPRPDPGRDLLDLVSPARPQDQKTTGPSISDPVAPSAEEGREDSLEQ